MKNSQDLVDALLALPEQQQINLVRSMIEIQIVLERTVIGDLETQLPDWVKDLKGQSATAYVYKLADVSNGLLKKLGATRG